MTDDLSFEKLKVETLDQLKKSSCIKFGEFKLKSGIISPVYVDMRESTMYPVLFGNIVKLVKAILPKDKQFNDWISSSQTVPPVAVIGVPYGVVPLAGAVANECKLAYYPVRKEVKDYGSKPDSKSFDNFEYIVIEDVMSTGSSIIETLKKLENKKVTDIIVVVDREFGGQEKLQAEYPHIKLHSIFKQSDLMNTSE